MNYWQTTSRFIFKCGPLPHMFSPKRNVINIRRKWHSVHNIMLQHLFWKHLGRNLRCVCLILTTIWQIVMPELYNRKCMLSKRLYIVHLIYRKSWWLCLSVSFFGSEFSSISRQTTYRIYFNLHYILLRLPTVNELLCPSYTEYHFDPEKKDDNFADTLKCILLNENNGILNNILYRLFKVIQFTILQHLFR